MLSFGNLGSSDAGDPRRGTFATGAQYDTGKAIWPSNSPAPVFGDNVTGGRSAGDLLAGFGGLSMGTTIGGKNSPASRGVNTAQVDGTSGFFGTLSGFGSALLEGIGVQAEEAAKPQPQQASYNGGTVAGVDVKTIAIVGIVGAAIYYAAGR